MPGTFPVALFLRHALNMVEFHGKDLFKSMSKQINCTKLSFYHLTCVEGLEKVPLSVIFTF